MDLPSASRWIVWAPALASLLLVSLGVVLAYTWAYPDVQCTGDACSMTWNVFAIPAMLIGGALGIASVVVFSLRRTHGPPTAKH